MAAVRAVINFKVKAGRLADLFEGLRTVKKTVERLGANVAVNRQAFGPEPDSIVMVVQWASWDALSKARGDSEFERLLETMRSNPNPAFESVARALYEEVTL
jgi:hypothetical protein